MTKANMSFFKTLPVQKAELNRYTVLATLLTAIHSTTTTAISPSTAIPVTTTQSLMTMKTTKPPMLTVIVVSCLAEAALMTSAQQQLSSRCAANYFGRIVWTIRRRKNRRPRRWAHWLVIYRVEVRRLPRHGGSHRHLSRRRR